MICSVYLKLNTQPRVLTSYIIRVRAVVRIFYIIPGILPCAPRRTHGTGWKPLHQKTSFPPWYKIGEKFPPQRKIGEKIPPKFYSAQWKSPWKIIFRYFQKFYESQQNQFFNHLIKKIIYRKSIVIVFKITKSCWQRK